MTLQQTGYLILLEVLSNPETGDFLEAEPLPSVPTPPAALSAPLPSSYLLLPARVFSVFLIRHIDKYWCAQGLCYDIFIVCVHVEDVDINTAFYHTLNAALAHKASRFSRFI